MLLNQTDTGYKNDTHANALRRRVKKVLDDHDSLMQTIPVHAFELAMTLDRLEYLEKYVEFVNQQLRVLNNGISYK